MIIKRGKVSFRKMRSVGGVMVSCKGDKGSVLEAEFSSKKPTTIKVKNNFGTRFLQVSKNGETKTIEVEIGEIFTIELDGNVVVKSN